MTSSLDTLKPEFRKLLEELLDGMQALGFAPRVTWTLRTPVEQAKMWRRGRPLSKIREKIDELDRQGLDYLSHCLRVAGPQMEKQTVTNALPGLSWHQYGEAADIALFENGKLIHDGNHKAYREMADEAKLLGLTSGISWGDAGHVQYSRLSKPHYSLANINKMMREKFEGGKNG